MKLNTHILRKDFYREKKISNSLSENVLQGSFPMPDEAGE